MVATARAVPPVLITHLYIKLSAVVLALFPGPLRPPYDHRHLWYEAIVVRVLNYRDNHY